MILDTQTQISDANFACGLGVDVETFRKYIEPMLVHYPRIAGKVMAGSLSHDVRSRDKAARLFSRYVDTMVEQGYASALQEEVPKPDRYGVYIAEILGYVYTTHLEGDRTHHLLFLAGTDEKILLHKVVEYQGQYHLVYKHIPLSALIELQVLIQCIHDDPGVDKRLMA